MFTRNTFYIVDFAVKPGMRDPAKEIVRAQFLPIAREYAAQIDEYVWFESDDGRRFFQFASFRSTDAAIRHREINRGSQRWKDFGALCEASAYRIAGSRPEQGHELFRDPAEHFNEICRHEHSHNHPFGKNLFYVLELACEPEHAQAIEAMMISDFTPRVAHADPDVEDYVWFMNDSRNRFLQLASYTTAAGVLNHYHTSNGTERVARLFDICQMENARIFGQMSGEVAKLYSPPLWAHFTEFARLERAN